MLPSGRSPSVSDSELLQRSIISKKQFLSSTKRPKPSLFSPNPHIELSVSRTEGLSPDQAKELADEVAKKRGKDKSLGSSSIKAEAVRSEGLEVQSSEPPLHHANIVGWPSPDDPDAKRLEHLKRAKRLVEHADLKIW